MDMDMHTHMLPLHVDLERVEHAHAHGTCPRAHTPTLSASSASSVTSTARATARSVLARAIESATSSADLIAVSDANSTFSLSSLCACSTAACVRRRPCRRISATACRRSDSASSFALATCGARARAHVHA